ncbi:MAG: chemotaxis protein CheW [Bermanella sp.]
MSRSDSSQPGTGTVKVKTVVKEYLDTLLADIFPDIEGDIEEDIAEELEAYIQEGIVPEPVALEKPELTTPKVKPKAALEEIQSASSQVKDLIQTPVDIVKNEPKTEATDSSTMEEEVKVEPVAIPVLQDDPSADSNVDTNIQSAFEINQEPEVELAYPDAPPWAQTSFDILLFDVCGLKLAVSMETLGRIIKVEHDTSQIIGKPPWFIGAYHESDQHLYVVDTAKFIMPEKGFDLARDGFGYLIQLQRSDWTLACKEVYKTVRISPEQVKWRSQKGKRQWLAGTVIEHMCALVHVDTLIELLKEQAS